MGMASAAAAAGGESWIVERAKEELQMLEAVHPNGFDYLKLELKSFIFEDANTYSYTSAAPATQASSNNRHLRKKCEELIHDEQTKHDYNNSPSSSQGKKKKKKKDRVDMAIERAEACLKRIQLVKQTFFQ